MTTRIIGKWEFEQRGERELSYRLTAGGARSTVIGGGVFCAVCAFVTYIALAYPKNTAGWYVPFLFGGLMLAALVVVISSVRLRTVPHVLDRAANRFRRGGRTLFALSDIVEVAAVYHEPLPSNIDNTTPVKTNDGIVLVLQNGRRYQTHLGERSHDETDAQVDVIHAFLAKEGRPVPRSRFG